MSIWKRVSRRVFGNLVLKVVEKEDRTDTYIIQKGGDHGHVVAKDGKIVYSRTPTGRVLQDNANGIVDGQLVSSSPTFNRLSRRKADELFGSDDNGDTSGGRGCAGCPYR